MLSRPPLLSRTLPNIRTSRPVNGQNQRPGPRLFSRRARLLLQHQPAPSRPHIPYLTAYRPKLLLNPFYRHISTETSQNLKYQLKLGLYWTIIGWTLFGAAALAYFVGRQDWLSRLYPVPSDWPFFARYRFREARHEEETGLDSEPNIVRLIQYWPGAVGDIEKLGHLVPNPQPDWSIPGIGSHRSRAEAGEKLDPIGLPCLGRDISEKAKGWKEAYFTAWMSMASLARLTDDYVIDPARGILCERAYVLGPSNPYPRPMPPKSKASQPLEENCKRVMDDASVIYVRLLTTKGFDHRQRMKAALGYASWLDHQGDQKTALELYKWALGIACDGVSERAKAAEIVDRETGFIKKQAPIVTPNILEACTDLASHHARTGNVPLALNVFSSILRARQTAAEKPKARLAPRASDDLSLTSIGSWTTWLTAIVTMQNPSVVVPPSGDEEFKRDAAARCEEAATMTYLGEILFARAGESNPKGRAEGIAWTRDAVGKARAGLSDKHVDSGGKKTCRQCMETGLQNWLQMVSLMASEEKAEQKRRLEAGSSASAAASNWLSFWGRPSEQAIADSLALAASSSGVESWAQEEKKVAGLRAQVMEEKMVAALRKQMSAQSGWLSM